MMDPSSSSSSSSSRRRPRKRLPLLATIILATGFSFLCLYSLPSLFTPPHQHLLLLQCGILLTILPFPCLLYLCLRPPMPAGAWRAPVDRNHVGFAYFFFCCGVVLWGSVSKSRTLTAMQQDLVVLLGSVLIFASLVFCFFSAVAAYVPQWPVEDPAVAEDLEARSEYGDQLDESVRLSP